MDLCQSELFDKEYPHGPNVNLIKPYILMYVCVKKLVCTPHHHMHHNSFHTSSR